MILGVLVIGSLGGYECGNATFLQAVFNALAFSALIGLVQILKMRKKRAVVKQRQDKNKDKINYNYYTW
jgi:predicted lipid-binding transport protein (Tim44 family)